MTLKKALCAVMAIVMLFALTACRRNGGVMAYELNIKINGVPISDPLTPHTVDMLGSDYSVRLDPYDDTFGHILYKDQVIALAEFDQNAAGNDIRKRNIKSLSGKSVSVNGVTIGSSMSDVKNAIFSPTEKDSQKEFGIETWFYRKEGKSDSENYLIIWFEGDKVFDMVVDLELL